MALTVTWWEELFWRNFDLNSMNWTWFQLISTKLWLPCLEMLNMWLDWWFRGHVTPSRPSIGSCAASGWWFETKNGQPDRPFQKSSKFFKKLTQATSIWKILTWRVHLRLFAAIKSPCIVSARSERGIGFVSRSIDEWNATVVVIKAFGNVQWN